ncbi:MAG: C45 family peptidase [Bryobacteraceae bacterium]|nr:C45 family peptidase [Bryobacteraceae bacterium]
MLNRREFVASSVAATALAAAPDTRNGWVFVTLSGTPEDIGFQHGAQLSSRIVEGRRAIETVVVHDTKKDWTWFRDAAKTVFWPRIEDEYRRELAGIAKGMNSKGVAWDVWDIVALNGWMELAWYYVGWLDRQKGQATSNSSGNAPEHCSAFVATGSYTADQRPVMAHNAWVDFAIGAHWNVIFDIRPRNGHRILMDGYPGLIHSGDDFAINSAGMMITETTISGFHGFDPKGVPEFVRARKAAQYASSIDDYSRIMTEGNNGGYANNWLLAHAKTGEIASLELGLKNVVLKRTSDGYFSGSNYPEDAKLAREETDFPLSNPDTSPATRRERWRELMEEHKGRIDVELAKKFLADDYDTIEKKPNACERTLCGRNDLSPRGMKPWQPEYGPAGAVQNKAADARMAAEMRMLAAMGPQAGPSFQARAHIAAHPEFDYLSGVLKDLPAQPWTEFRAAR